MTEVPEEERELFEYFAKLYKNSNKGIKGRGKDRKIAGPNSSHSTNNSMMIGVGGSHAGMPGAMSSSMSTFPGMTVATGLPGMHGSGLRAGGGHNHGGADVAMGRVYEMDEMDEDGDMNSQCGSGSGSGSGDSMYGYDNMDVDVPAPSGRQMGYGNERLY